MCCIQGYCYGILKICLCMHIGVASMTNFVCLGNFTKINLNLTVQFSFFEQWQRPARKFQIMYLNLYRLINACRRLFFEWTCLAWEPLSASCASVCTLINISTCDIIVMQVYKWLLYRLSSFNPMVDYTMWWRVLWYNSTAQWSPLQPHSPGLKMEVLWSLTFLTYEREPPMIALQPPQCWLWTTSSPATQEHTSVQLVMEWGQEMEQMSH